MLTVAASGSTGHDPAELAVSARQEGDHRILDGVQTAVPWAYNADLVVVPARTDADRTVLILVPRVHEHEGVVLVEQFSTHGERLRDLPATGTCAPALGLGSQVLRMTSEYTGKREQFGFPVATFQAVAVQAADRSIDLRATEATLWQAAWRISSGAPGALPAAGDVAVAKI